MIQEAKQARVFLDRLLHDGLEALKAAFHVTPAQVIYFIPLLFVVVFILRSFSDFLNGYAFQHLGLGATNDLRNDLYARTLGADQPLPRRAPLGRAGEPGRARRRRAAGGGLDPARRPRAAVGDPGRPALPPVLDPVQAGALLPRGGAAGALSDRPLQQEHAEDQPPHPGAHGRPREPGLRVVPRPPGRQGLRHGGRSKRRVSARRRGVICAPTCAARCCRISPGR